MDYLAQPFMLLFPSSQFDLVVGKLQLVFGVGMGSFLINPRRVLRLLEAFVSVVA